MTNHSLEGKRIGALESRMAGQLGDLIRKRGAEVMSAPALREAPVDCLEMVGELIGGISDGEFQVVVAQTGVGVSTLFREAAKLGRESELLTGLRKAVCVARGPKPVAALRKAGIPTPVKVRSPYTTDELLETLGEFDLSGCGVALINYGERNEALSEPLLSACANLYELCLYEWMLPEDTEPLESLIRAVLKRELGRSGVYEPGAGEAYLQDSGAAGIWLRAVRDDELDGRSGGRTDMRESALQLWCHS